MSDRKEGRESTEEVQKLQSVSECVSEWSQSSEKVEWSGVSGVFFLSFFRLCFFVLFFAVSSKFLLIFLHNETSNYNIIQCMCLVM